MTNEVARKLLKEIKGDPTILQPAGRYVEPLEMAIKALEEPERKKGKWTDDNACQFCGFQPWFERDIHTLSFCPSCGAKMIDVGDRE